MNLYLTGVTAERMVFLFVMLGLPVFAQGISTTLLDELTDYPNCYLLCGSCQYKAFMNEEFSVLLFDRDKNLIKELKSTKAQDIFLVEFNTGQVEFIIIKGEGSTYPVVNDYISFKIEDSSKLNLDEITLLPKDRHYFIITSNAPLILFKNASIHRDEKVKEALEIEPVLMRFYLECPHQAVAVVNQNQEQIKAVSSSSKKDFSLPEFAILFAEGQDLIKITIPEKARTMWKNLRISLYDTDLDKVFLVEKEEFKIEEKKEEEPFSRFLVRFVEVKR